MAEHRNREANLRDCRRRIEALAGEGRFRVVCARVGTEPIPVAGLRFADRETAATAARLTRTYRAALRRWDPETAWCDPIVHERRSDESTTATGGRPTARVPTAEGEP